MLRVASLPALPRPFRVSPFVLAVAAGIALGVLAVLPGAQAQPASPGPASVDASWMRDLEVRPVGPTRGGRVTAVEGHRAHPHTFYMGAAGGGGVWKTTDRGQTWTNLSDGAGFSSTSIGAIEVADSDTSVVYVGTGTDGLRANVTTGRGMYRSTDAGASWSPLGLKDAGQIGAVEVHPDDPSRVYVAALGHPFRSNEQRGVFRSSDGGRTWEKVLYASDSTGAIDLELNPADPSTIYAGMWRGERKPWTIVSGAAEEDGIYKSTDGGDTWEKIENGLPSGLTGKVDFAVPPADPDRVYALVEAPGDRQGLYRSDDRGESWTQVSDAEGIMTRPFYFTNITAHPTDPNTVYVGNVDYYVSTDGGRTFEEKPATHVDVHDLWINPETPRLRIQGNDGGATVSVDGGATWSTQYNQPTAELYQVNVDERFPYWLYAGQQDNSTIAVPSRPPAESAPAGPKGWWHSVGGCETGPVVPQPNTPVVFANCKGRFGRFNRQSGQEKQYWVGAQYMYGRNPAELEYRFQRVVPIEISPHDSSVVYHASQFVHKTTDGGETWARVSPDLTANKPQYQVASGRPITRDITGEEHYSALYAVQVSPHDPDVVWAGSNDGPVHVTRDGGETWTDVTPDVPPNGRVDAIAPSPHEPGTATVAIQRRLLGDFTPYIYRTTDYGETWTRRTGGEGGIPSDYPVRVVREDPNREGLLYAGTDFGLFVSFDAGAHWQQIEQGLPVTPVTDIRIHQQDLVMATMGRGFWIMDNLTPLYQLDAAVAGADRHLFRPRPAHRMRYWAGRGGSGAPEYPPAGATIDFYLDEAPDAPVVLEIMTEDGTVVRQFTHAPGGSTGGGGAASTGNAMATPASVRPTAGDLSVHAGHNRFVWNLRYPGPTPESVGEQAYFGAGRGPMAAPGTYRVRLSVGDWSATRTFEVRMDPRVRETGVSRSDLEEQLALNLDIRDAIGEARALARRTDTLRTRIDRAADAGEIEAGEAESMQETLASVRDRVTTSTDPSYPPPMLIDQLEYLYYMTTSADQKLGGDAFTRYETLRERLEGLQDRVDEVREASGLPAASR
jgi:photosystem II stability/assembly factor-like uncharacterized protein